MHRALAAWLMAKNWRAPILAAIFGILSPQGLLSPVAVVAGAIPVLVVLVRGPRAGLDATLAGCIAVGAILMTAGQTVLAATANAALLFLAPYGLAVVAQRTGSLRLGFQLGTLAAWLALTVVFTGMDAVVASWEELYRPAAKLTVQLMGQWGVIADEQTLLRSLVRSLGAMWLLTVLGSLFLGCWWQSLTQAPGAFGKEFQQLRLGKVLGAAAMLVVCGAFAVGKLKVDVPLVEALVWVATVALACQGLAAVHRLKASGLVGSGWLTAVYVLLIATTPVMLTLLAGWGVVDNWRRPA